MLDPQICNIAIDANALDRDGSARDALVDRFEALDLSVVVAQGVRREVQSPRTPANVQAAVLPRIFNLRPGLNDSQLRERRLVAAVLQGNAQPGKHAADASHLSEAAETGCAYFITHDKRLIKMRDELRGLLPPSLAIVSLEEFLQIVDHFQHERAHIRGGLL